MCEDFSKIEKIVSLKYSVIKIFLLVLMNILTVGIINLFIVWYPKLKLCFIYSSCFLGEAKFIGIFGADLNLPDIRNSHLKRYCNSNVQDLNTKMFEFKLFKYIYDSTSNSFHATKFNIKTTQQKLHSNFSKGLNQTEILYQKKIFRECDLDIKIDSVFKLILKEVTDPFYLFQVFSVTLWMCTNYQKYATIIIITTLISLIFSVWETKSNLLSVQKMAKYSCPVEVFRFNSDNTIKLDHDESQKQGEKLHQTISSVELVPGDIFELPNEEMTLPCDCILINGNVIINEAMLTGESTPIIKTHLPNTSNTFDAQIDKKYLLYAGTKIIQKRSIGGSKVMGLVYSTGFNTEKGNLIRRILFPRETQFRFKNDSVKFILFMGCLSLTGFLISLPFMIENGITIREIFVRAMDLVTTTVPPSLPACLGIGITYALSRLKKAGIMCINRDRVNMAGKINMICFDKTGTLTEDHLDINGFRPVKLKNNSFIFDNFTTNCREISDECLNYYRHKMNNGKSEKSKDMNQMFIECLSTCHSITKVNGKLVGDPIDIKMFESSTWHLNENLEDQENYDSLISTFVRPSQEKDLKEKLSSDEYEDEDYVLRTHYELGIVRRFDFSSKLQRMSVIGKNVNEPYFKAFCKGSPEKIKELCKQDTIPFNFNHILSKYTMKGYRVLALAAKMLKMDYLQSQKIDRSSVESNMIFLGLMIVQNKLKDQTTPSIETLQDANLRMVMATGDNILTAISVAKDCLLIKPEATVYTCEINKDDTEHTLTWNIVESFLDKDEDKSIVEEHMLELNLSNGGMYLDNKEHDLRGFTAHFHPESISDLHTLNYETKINEEKSEIKKELNELENSQFVNIDTEKYPFHGNSEGDYIIAISGSTFETLWKLRNKYLTTKIEKDMIYYETFRKILQNCYIFARMSPEHKTILVECLREEKFTVCMCGDGANDCGALRAADVGVSLSIEEASIAAHFTSNTADISCLIKLLREGKASLVASIQTFKYMMIYSLIQFMSVTLLIIFKSYLTDNQFLTTDVFIIFPMAILIGRTGAYHKLTAHQPTGALISVPIISSILIQTIVQFSAQFGAWILLYNQTSWYKNYCVTEDDNVSGCFDNTAIFLVSNIQYLTTAIAFSISKPFRKPIYSNYLLCIFIVIAFAYSIYIIVDPDYYSADLLQIVEFPDESFKYYLLIITLANFIVSYFIEKAIIPCITQKWRSYKYRKILNEIIKQQKQYNLSQLHKIRVI